MLPGEVDGQQLDLLIAADDDDAKQKVSHAVDEEVLSPVARAEEAVGNPIFEIVNGIRDVISPVHELARSFAEETLGEAYSEPAQDVGDYIAYVKSQGA